MTRMLRREVRVRLRRKCRSFDVGFDVIKMGEESLVFCAKGGS